jgi:lipopolysaccharide transport system ATP-binding protein
MSDVAIRVDGIGKEYRIGKKKGAYKTLRESIIDMSVLPLQKAGSLFSNQKTEETAQEEPFWALRDVSFEVKRGEVVGIIGANGAGKSTLLKILSRITEPTEGEATVHGRLGSLLEVGIGFHPELTGRDNIYLNGAILGLKKSEVRQKFDEIVAFSHVEQFIDTPLKHYSSGMYLCLAFAVAAHLDTENLLVDEVLAVGDVRFQKKCLEKMGQVAREGRTVLFVSHNLADITRLCHETILLEHGVVKAKGKSEEIVNFYLNSSFDNDPLSSPIQHRASGKKPFELTNVALFDRGGNSIKVVRTGQDFSIRLQYTTDGSCNLQNSWAWLTCTDSSGKPLFACNSLDSRPGPLPVPSKGALVCQFKKFPLLPGNYILGFTFKDNNDVAWLTYEGILRLQVVEGDFFGTGKLPGSRTGPFLVDHCWDAMDEFL